MGKTKQRVQGRVIRDNMCIESDVPITMDDGIVLRADVYRPLGDGRYPIILSHGPYAKGLSFQDAYGAQWRKMVAEHPDVEAGSTNKYQTWEAVDPEKWVPDGYICVRVDSRGAGLVSDPQGCYKSAGSASPQETDPEHPGLHREVPRCSR